jgi:hypothetical protein
MQFKYKKKNNNCSKNEKKSKGVHDLFTMLR